MILAVRFVWESRLDLNKTKCLYNGQMVLLLHATIKKVLEGIVCVCVVFSAVCIQAISPS